MPDIPILPPIVLKQTAIDRLNLVVTAYNIANGTALDLSGWIHLFLRERAIQDELLATAQTLQNQSATDLHAAIQTTRANLMASV